MGEDVKIEVTTDVTKADADLKAVAYRVQSLGKISARASQQAAVGATKAITAATGALTRITTLFGLTGVIGAVFGLIAVVQRLGALWAKLFPVSDDPFQRAATSVDAATKALKRMADSYAALEAARKSASKDAAALAESQVDRTAARLQAEEDAVEDPDARAEMQRRNAAFLARRKAEADLAASGSAASDAEAAVADNRARRETISGRLEKVQDTPVFGRSAAERQKASAAVAEFTAEIARLDAALPSLNSAVDAARNALDAARIRSDAALNNMRRTDAAIGKERTAAQLEADLAAAEQAYQPQQRAAEERVKRRAIDAEFAKEKAKVDKDTADKISKITVEAPRAASSAAASGGITGGSMNNAARLADQRAAAVEALMGEQNRILAEIRERLDD